MKRSEMLRACAEGDLAGASQDGATIASAMLHVASELAALRELLEERLPLPVSDVIAQSDYENRRG